MTIPSAISDQQREELTDAVYKVLKARSLTRASLAPLAAAIIEMLEKRAPWILSKKDSAAFVDALLHPPEPNEALKAAAERYKASIESGKRT